MGRHSFSAVWSAPQRYRSRRPAAVAIGVSSLVIIVVVFGMIWLNTAPPAPESSGSTTTTATSTEIAESTSSATPTTSAPPAVVVAVTVLNNSAVNGLAARVAALLEAGGWPIADLRNYSETQVPATTAFFTPGVVAEEAAARAMVAQFPQISGGAAPRFAGLDGTGLTVTAVGDWVP